MDFRAIFHSASGNDERCETNRINGDTKLNVWLGWWCAPHESALLCDIETVYASQPAEGKRKSVGESAHAKRLALRIETYAAISSSLVSQKQSSYLPNGVRASYIHIYINCCTQIIFFFRGNDEIHQPELIYIVGVGCGGRLVGGWFAFIICVEFSRQMIPN